MLEHPLRQRPQYNKPFRITLHFITARTQARTYNKYNNNNNNNISDDIRMEFGLDKCAKATFKRGKKVSAEGILLHDHQLIQDLDQAETYKYLGMEEGE